MKQVDLEEILIKIFQPTSQDCSTPAQDLQLAITLNPDLNRIKNAMQEACNQTVDLCAENAEVGELHEVAESISGGPGYTYYEINKQSILDTKKQIV